MESVINYFGEFLFWDIYVQGILATLVILIGTSLWLYTLGEYFDPSENIDIVQYMQNNYKGLYDLITIGIKLKVARYISYFVISLTIIYNVGLHVSQSSDDFMDASNLDHLLLKQYWSDSLKVNEHFLTSNKFLDLSHTDERIKIEQFDRVFHIPTKDTLAESPDSTDYKIFLESVFNDSKGIFRTDIYYFAKHSLLSDDKWRNYITYSQNLINISQVAAFSLFILFCMCLINFIFDFLRILKEIFGRQRLDNIGVSESENRKITEVSRNKLILYLLVSLFTVILYGISGLFKLHLNWIIVFISLFLFFWLTCWIFSVSTEWIGKRTRATLIISVFSLIGYFASSNSWLTNEKEICNKIYGVFKFKENAKIVTADKEIKILLKENKKDTKL
jgi:hypothetical protein